MTGYNVAAFQPPSLMPGPEILAVLALAAVAWYWLDSVRARDTAVEAARVACEGERLLLLDDTVAIARIRPARDEDGRVRLQRAYEFEYSDSGDNRLKGSIVLLGRRVVMLNIGVRDGGYARLR